jgi:hypothetical protein
MKIKHYSIFNNSLEALNWEFLRNNPEDYAYYIPDEKSEYLKIVDTNLPSEFSKNIVEFCRQNNLTNVFSIGSGIGYLEYQIKKYSSLKVIISDNNDSIYKIKKFALFDDALKLDAFNDNLPVDANSLVIFPRIDTEFEDDQLRILFEKCNKLGVVFILFLPAELLSIKILLAEFKIYLIAMITSKKRIFCGYARSYSHFRKIWGGHYITMSMPHFKNSFILKLIK